MSENGGALVFVVIVVGLTVSLATVLSTMSRQDAKSKKYDGDLRFLQMTNESVVNILESYLSEPARMRVRCPAARFQAGDPLKKHVSNQGKVFTFFTHDPEKLTRDQLKQVYSGVREGFPPLTAENAVRTKIELLKCRSRLFIEAKVTSQVLRRQNVVENASMVLLEQSNIAPESKIVFAKGTGGGDALYRNCLFLTTNGIRRKVYCNTSPPTKPFPLGVKTGICSSVTIEVETTYPSHPNTCAQNKRRSKIYQCKYPDSASFVSKLSRSNREFQSSRIKDAKGRKFLKVEYEDSLRRGKSHRDFDDLQFKIENPENIYIAGLEKTCPR